VEALGNKFRDCPGSIDVVPIIVGIVAGIFAVGLFILFAWWILMQLAVWFHSSITSVSLLIYNLHVCPGIQGVQGICERTGKRQLESGLISCGQCIVCVCVARASGSIRTVWLNG
jgi:hypothetical protein